MAYRIECGEALAKVREVMVMALRLGIPRDQVLVNRLRVACGGNLPPKLSPPIWSGSVHARVFSSRL